MVHPRYTYAVYYQHSYTKQGRRISTINGTCNLPTGAHPDPLETSYVQLPTVVIRAHCDPYRPPSWNDICIYVHLSIYTRTHPSYICNYMYICIYVYTHLSIYLLIYPFMKALESDPCSEARVPGRPSPQAVHGCQARSPGAQELLGDRAHHFVGQSLPGPGTLKAMSERR